MPWHLEPNYTQNKPGWSCRSEKSSGLCYGFLDSTTRATALFTMQTPCVPRARHGFIRSAIVQGRNPPSPSLWKTENLSDRKWWNLSFRRHSTPWKLLHFYEDFMGIYSVDTHTLKYPNFQDNSKHRAFNKNTINFKILAWAKYFICCLEIQLA